MSDLHLSHIPEIMFEINHSDWFVNQDKIPDINSTHYKDFWDYHEKLCLAGCFIEGVRIPGFLYWHLNFWSVDIDILNEYGLPTSELRRPLLRDNEFIIANAIERAEIMRPNGIGRKGLVLGGSRRIAKSSIVSSYMGYGVTFDENSQNVFAALNEPDIDITTPKIATGLANLPEVWKWSTVGRADWGKQVDFGVKAKRAQDDKIFSSLIIRNLHNGNNQEGIAGTKPRKLIIEEAGKGAFLSGLTAAKPGFTTPLGAACSPIIIFTGGDMTRFEDAKKLMYNPDAYDFITFDEDKPGKRQHGLFLGAKYRQEAKVESTLGDFLNTEKKRSPLYQIPMMVSDEKLAIKMGAETLEKYRLAGDRENMLKTKMYFPVTVDDIFLNTGNTKYDKDLLQAQESKILSERLGGTQVDLHFEGIGVTWTPSKKMPLIDLENRGDMDAPITVYEFPIPDPPKFLYVAGVDSYRHDKAPNSNSLGAVYIFKRFYDITGESMQDCFVASYVARPDNKEDWNANARKLIRFYNAYTLVENDEISFIDYMKVKGDAEMYLAPEPRFQKALTMNSKMDRGFGVSRAGEKVRDFLDGLLGRHFTEVISSELDDSGAIIREVKGIQRVFDLRLLREAKIYDGNLNADAIVAAQLALALSNELDPLLGTKAENRNEQDQRFKALFGGKKSNKRGTFIGGKSRKSRR